MSMRLRDVGSRKLDMFKPVFIVRSEENFNFEDEFGSVQSVPEAERVVSLEPVVKRKKLNIPVPIVEEDPDYEKNVSPSFVTPSSHVLRDYTLDRMGGALYDYSLEEEDINWYWDNPKIQKDPALKKVMKLTLFEDLINFLELETRGGEEPLNKTAAEQRAMVEFDIPKPTISRIMDEVYPYWQRKRSRQTRSLIRQFHPQTPANETIDKALSTFLSISSF